MRLGARHVIPNTITVSEDHELTWKKMHQRHRAWKEDVTAGRAQKFAEALGTSQDELGRNPRLLAM